MTRLELSQADITYIEVAMNDPSLSDKHRTKLLVEGGRHGFIARCFKLHAITITHFLKECCEGGLPAVVEDKYYNPSSSIELFLTCLRCSFAAVPVDNAKVAIARIEALYKSAKEKRVNEGRSARAIQTLRRTGIMQAFTCAAVWS